MKTEHQKRVRRLVEIAAHRDPIDWPWPIILGILLAVFVGGLWIGRVLAP